MSIAAVLLTTAACSSSQQADDDARDLTIALAVSPTSIDPALASPPAAVWPAYEPLIYRDNDGSLVPALATDWQYLDDENQVFEITLREDVLFADGDELTPEAVKASLERFLSLPDNPDIRYTGDVGSIEVTGENTLVINFDTPNPAAAVALTQDYKYGLIISPTGLSDVDALGSQTHGAGQYVLVPDETVDGSTYVYEPNENYWNQDAVKFSRITYNVLPDTASQLSALQSSQADIVWDTSADNVQTAEDAGFQYVSAGGVIQGIFAVTRDKDPLDDPLVREAFRYAIDRDAIVEAVYSGLGSPAYSLFGPGTDGYSDPEPIAYDPQRSKELLAQAGYPDGVQIQLLSSSGWDPNSLLASALQQQLAEGGFEVELVTVGTGLSDFITPLYAMTYATAQFGLSAGADSYFQLTVNAYSPGTLVNVLGETDAEIDSLLDQASRAQGDEYEALMQELGERFDALNWFIPVAVANSHYLVSPDLGNLPDSSVQQQLDPFSPEADNSWEFTS